MKCKQCQHGESKVLESRENRENSCIRRRRECIQCGFRFTTFERVGDQPVYVFKRNGLRELFSREKIIRSLTIACQKRSIDPKKLEHIADWVESHSQLIDEDEMTTQKIGEFILNALIHVDPVAYVRFASVYRAFSTPEDFINELKILTEKSKATEIPAFFQHKPE